MNFRFSIAEKSIVMAHNKNENMIFRTTRPLKGRRCKIGRGVRFYGQVVIHDDVYIGDYCVIGYLMDDFGIDQHLNREQSSNCITTIHRGAHIRPFSIIGIGTTIGEDCWLDFRSTVGSFTILEQEAELWYGAQIHNRVTIGEKSIVSGFVAMTRG